METSVEEETEHMRKTEKESRDVAMELHLTKQSPCTSEFILQALITYCHYL